MKSITVTPFQSYNYGGILQAYALQCFQKSLGIDNRLLKLPVFRQKYRKWKWKGLRDFLFTAYANVTAFLSRKEIDAVRKKFDAFIDAHLATTDLYGTREALWDNPPAADFYLCGSDQVFALRNTQAYARLLGWVPEGKYRCSYAASLGEYDWNDRDKAEFSKVLGTFDAISVREPYAQSILSGLSGKKIRVHLDPVFLLHPEDYDAVTMAPPFKDPYILVYPLLGNSALQEVIDKSKKCLGCDTVSVRVSRLIQYQCDHCVYDAGPSEFLGLLRNAKAILSTSFHGMALACLFHKPFYVLTKNYKSQRITDLLGQFALGDRLFMAGDDVSFDVDFRTADAAIEAGRKKAKDYFKSIVAAAGGGT
jgi:hypothetical protein